MAETDKMNIDFKEMIPRITEEVAVKMREGAFNSLKWQMEQAVSAAVKEYITESIVPSVKKELAAHDAEIRAAVVAGVKATCLGAVERMIEEATKKMAGYQGDEIVAKMMEAMFGRNY